MQDHVHIMLSIPPRLKYHGLFLLATFTTLIYGHIVDAKLTETRPKSELSSQEQSETGQTIDPNVSPVSNQLQDSDSLFNLPIGEPMVFTEFAGDEDPTESDQTHDVGSAIEFSESDSTESGESATPESSTTPDLSRGTDSISESFISDPSEHSESVEFTQSEKPKANDTFESFWKLEKEERIYVAILAILYSVILASAVNPAIKGFQTEPMSASGLTGFLLICLYLTLDTHQSPWFFWLTIFILCCAFIGWFVHLLTDLMDRVVSFFKALGKLLPVGVVSVAFGPLVLMYNPHINETGQFGFIFFVITCFSIAGGALLANR